MDPALRPPDGIDTVGEAVAEKIAVSAPHGESLTDRAKLRAELGEDDWGADGILIVDAGPSPKLDAIIKKARATGADKFADWLETRSTRTSEQSTAQSL